MKYKYVLVILILIFSGCTTTNKNIVTEFKPTLSEDKKVLRNLFVGKWISEQPNDKGGVNVTTVERMADSRYINEFKIFSSARILEKEQKEFGYWGVAGGVYFTMFRGWINGETLTPSDPTNAYNYDSYKIVESTPNRLIYKSLSSGNLYTYTRVK
jgi:hypothetical protein